MKPKTPSHQPRPRARLFLLDMAKSVWTFYIIFENLFAMLAGERSCSYTLDWRRALFFQTSYSLPLSARVEITASFLQYPKKYAAQGFPFTLFNRPWFW